MADSASGASPTPASSDRRLPAIARNESPKAASSNPGRVNKFQRLCKWHVLETCRDGDACINAHEYNELQENDQEYLPGGNLNGDFCKWIGPLEYPHSSIIPNARCSALSVRKGVQDVLHGREVPSWVPILCFLAMNVHGDEFLTLMSDDKLLNAACRPLGQEGGKGERAGTDAGKGTGGKGGSGVPRHSKTSRGHIRSRTWEEHRRSRPKERSRRRSGQREEGKRRIGGAGEEQDKGRRSRRERSRTNERSRRRSGHGRSRKRSRKRSGGRSGHRRSRRSGHSSRHPPKASSRGRSGSMKRRREPPRRSPTPKAASSSRPAKSEKDPKKTQYKNSFSATPSKIKN